MNPSMFGRIGGTEVDRFLRARMTHGARFLVGLLCAAMFLAGCAKSGGNPAQTSDPVVARGKALFNGTCAACHATTDDDVIVGPSLAGIYARAGARLPGTDAESYIRQSILDPRAYIVEGFPDNMMPVNYSQVFKPEDIDAILAYLKTLSK
jgi:cytochrome c2